MFLRRTLPPLLPSCLSSSPLAWEIKQGESQDNSGWKREGKCLSLLVQSEEDSFLLASADCC